VTANDASVITAIGMATPVGLTAAQSCAAMRAGISAIGELDFVIQNDSFEEVAVMGCALRGVTDGYSGLGRWTRLATAALHDLVTNAGLSTRELATAALYLALPPLGRGGVDARIAQLLGVRIAQWMGVAGIGARTRVFAEGHAAGAHACQEALADVERGAVERAVVCGVDSLIEPETLRFFVEKRRLKTEDRPDGLVPGEAAACFLLERAEQAKAHGARPLASIAAASTASESVTIWSDEPSAATGLSDAIRGTLEQLPDQGRNTRLVVCDLNGETYRSKEFGNTAARALSVIPVKWTVWHAADCIGDTGAAAFTVSACLGARALARGYAKSDGILVLGSSDDGLRGAAYLRRVQEA